MIKIRKTIDYIVKSFLGNKYLVFIILTAILFIKDIFFLAIITGHNSATLNWTILDQSVSYKIAQISFVILVASFIFLFKEKGKLLYTFIVNLVFSFLCIFELMYFRVYSNLLSIRMIFHPELFNPLNKKLFDLRRVDIVFVLDLAILFILITYYLCIHKKNVQKRSIIAFLIAFFIPVAIIYVDHYLIDVRNITKGRDILYYRGYIPQFSILGLGPIGYHIYDANVFSNIEKRFSENDKEKVDKWMENNYENITDNEFKGIFKGKNIIVIQWESLEEFIVGAKTNGQEITPNLNRLLENSLHFNNIYEQNKEGSSADGDFMANTGLMPLRRGVVFLDFPWRYTNSIQRMLEKEGYTTVSSHGEVPGIWNWAEGHVGLGVNYIWDIYSHGDGEKMSMGLYDKPYLQQLDDRIDNELKQKQPFYFFTTTLTSHGPFDFISDDERMLKLPEEVDNTYIGNYFQSIHYTDKYLGEFIDELEKKDILKNTSIVIYGDHGGVNKYYYNDLKDVNYENRWWTQNELKIPLIIYDESIKGQVISANGGLSDLTPTLAYLMGIDRENFKYTSVGRVLVNTNRNVTLKPDGTIIGEVKDEAEQEHLKETFKINEILLRTDYIKQKLKEID